MQKLIRLWVWSMAIMALSLLGSGPAQATLELIICDSAGSCAGTNPIIDNGAGDTNALTGVINFSSNLDGWIVIGTIDQSKPIIGSATNPKIDISFSATYCGGGTPGSCTAPGTDSSLLIEVTDTDFLTFGGFDSHIGGTNDHTSTSFADFADAGNTPFGLTTPICAGGPFIAPSYATDCFGSFGGPNPFSLTGTVTITALDSTGQASGDHLLRFVPEPGTLLLMGAAMAGLGFVRRRRAG